MRKLKGVFASVFGTAALVLCQVAFPVFAHAFTGGVGTLSDPYEISTCEELLDIDDDLDAHYELVNTINCNAIADFEPLGDYSGPGFSGILEGNGYTIADIFIDRPTEDGVGLFALIDGGEVRNLTIAFSEVTGEDYVGALAGLTTGGTVLTNVKVKDTVVRGENTVGGISGSLDDTTVTRAVAIDVDVAGADGLGTTNDIGGAFGATDNSEITRSHSTGTVVGNTENSGLSSYTGGLIGHAYSGTALSDSYSQVSVSGDNDVGGVLGLMAGSDVSRVYSSGTVEGDLSVGGVTGRLLSGTLEYSFAAGEITGVSEVGAVVGTTDSIAGGDIDGVAFDEYRTGVSDCVGESHISTVCAGMNGGNIEPDYFFVPSGFVPFIGWDFDDVWRVQTNNFPVLQSEPGGVGTIRVTPGPNSLVVTWEEVDDDGGNAVTSYEIMYKAESATSFTTATGISALTYTITGLAPSTQVLAQVRAVNAHGGGEWLGFITFTSNAAPTTSSSDQADKKTSASSSDSEATDTAVAEDAVPVSSANDIADTTSDPGAATETTDTEKVGSKSAVYGVIALALLAAGGYALRVVRPMKQG